MRRALRFGPLLGAAAVLLAVALAGCGQSQNVAEVSGTVTLGGQPLPNAIVKFAPKEAGVPSFGRTDASGKYRLQYTRDVAGAEIGEHTVSISSYSEGKPDEDPPVPPSPETVPAKYNVNTELTATVKSGSNPIDFALDSQGEIIQPDALPVDLD
jgi:hypothetical protein